MEDWKIAFICLSLGLAFNVYLCILVVMKPSRARNAYREQYENFTNNMDEFGVEPEERSTILSGFKNVDDLKRFNKRINKLLNEKHHETKSNV